MRQERRTGSRTAVRALAGAGLALLLGGCDAPTESGRSGLVLEVATPRRSAFIGSTLETPVRFHVTDRSGRPVEGAKLELVPLGDATATPIAQATNGQGNLDVLFKLGRTPGEYTLDARVAGSGATTRYTALATTLRLAVDSAVLALPSCEKTLAARTHDNPDPSYPDHQNRDVQYVVTEPGVVELSVPTYHGIPLTQSRRLRPLRPGVTRVVAVYQGGSDTAEVRVLGESELVPRAIRTTLPDTVAVPVGGRRPSSLHFWVEAQAECPVPGARPAISSADARIATVVMESGYPYLKGEAPGDTRLEARYGELSLSRPLRVRHVRAVPADTTLRVGETIEYQLWTADASGVWVQEPGATVHAFGPAATRRAGTALVTGAVPGTSDLVVFAGQWEAPARVRVVAN